MQGNPGIRGGDLEMPFVKCAHKALRTLPAG